MCFSFKGQWPLGNREIVPKKLLMVHFEFVLAKVGGSAHTLTYGT